MATTKRRKKTTAAPKRKRAAASKASKASKRRRSPKLLLQLNLPHALSLEAPELAHLHAGQRLALAGRTHERSHRPAWVEDDATWRKAIKAVKPHWKRYEHPYAVVAYVYQRMGGTVRHHAPVHHSSAPRDPDPRGYMAQRKRAEASARRSRATLGDPMLPHGGLDLDADRVELDELGYDDHGKYWGVGGQPLWRVRNANLDDEPQVDVVVRAATARAAKQRVLEQHRH